MNVFKKKPKAIIEGDGVVGPVEQVNPQPKLKPACGYEYKGTIYKTVKEADLAYQKDEVRRAFPERSLGFGDYTNRWVPLVLGNWEQFVEIAHKKLEVE